MKNSIHIFFAFAFLLCCARMVFAQTAHWVTGYFPGWEVGDGTTSRPPLNKVDFSSMTVVAYFGFMPYPDGNVDS